MSNQRTKEGQRRSRDVVWEHFEEVERRTKATNQPKARCNYCHERISGRPKVSMIPHLLNKCSQAPSHVKQQWHLTPSTLSNSTPDDTKSDDLKPMVQAPEPQASKAQASQPQNLHLQTLQLLRLKTKVAQYQAKAVEAESTAKVATYQVKALEAEFITEKLAARIKLQGIGIPDDEIERNLPSL